MPLAERNSTTSNKIGAKLPEFNLNLKKLYKKIIFLYLPKNGSFK